MISEQQEWTPEWLANFGNSENWLQEICNAHNAALAAKWDLGLQPRRYTWQGFHTKATSPTSARNEDKT